MSAPSSPTHQQLNPWSHLRRNPVNNQGYDWRISSLPGAVWRPGSYAPSSSLIGTHVTFDSQSRRSEEVVCVTHRNVAFAQSGGAVVKHTSFSLVIGDSREATTAEDALSKAAKLFQGCLKPPKTSKAVPAAIDGALASSNAQLRLENPGQKVVLLGSVNTGRKHYIFNQGGGMAYLLKKDGSVTCLTDHVLPGHPAFPVEGCVSPGEILFSDIPLRCQPFVTVGDEKCHAARGLGYPKQIPTDPLITRLTPDQSKGEMYILYVTQEGEQNVRKEEIEAAWRQSQGNNPQKIVKSITSWLERRSESTEPRMAVVLESLSQIPTPPPSYIKGKVNYNGSCIPVSIKK